jgi:hypothetical protein
LIKQMGYSAKDDRTFYDIGIQSPPIKGISSVEICSIGNGQSTEIDHFGTVEEHLAGPEIWASCNRKGCHWEMGRFPIVEIERAVQRCLTAITPRLVTFM